MERAFNKQDNQKMIEVIEKMILKNMDNGASFKKAKEQVFNRLNKEYPAVLNLFCKYNA